MDQDRKEWNQNQRDLQYLLSRQGDFQAAIPLFLKQHAALHSVRLSGPGCWSFQDEVLSGLQEPELRRIPIGGEHSIAWVLWHLARIEDVTMNRLVADRSQLLTAENWHARLKYTSLETGNALDKAGIASLSALLDLEAVLAYRLAVGIRTQSIVNALHPDDLQRSVPTARLERLLTEGSVVESTRGLLEYWSKRSIAGLLLMPATRHNYLHLNEASRIRSKLHIRAAAS